MAIIDELRRVKGSSTEHGRATRHVLAPQLMALLLLMIAAGSAVLALALSGRAHSTRPGLVARALGPNDPTFLLDRRWDSLTRVSVGDGLRIRRAGTSLRLTARGAGAAHWPRHAWG